MTYEEFFDHLYYNLPSNVYDYISTQMTGFTPQDRWGMIMDENDFSIEGKVEILENGEIKFDDIAQKLIKENAH